MLIEKDDKNFIFKIPLETERWNPYTDIEIGKMPTLCGLVIDKEGLGFAQRIDMSYKGKDDQVGDFVVKYHGELKDFEAECERLGLDIIYI